MERHLSTTAVPSDPQRPQDDLAGSCENGRGETDRIRWRNSPTNHQTTRLKRGQVRRCAVFSPISCGWPRASGLSPQRNKLLMLAGALVAVVGRDGLHADQAQFLEPSILQCADQQGYAGLPLTARRLRRAGGDIARPQRRADVAQSDLQSRDAPGPGRRSPERMAQAEARLSPVEFRRHRRQPGPAPAG